MDTARGIAEWWIKEDLDATQKALQQLVSCGVVVVKTSSNFNFYTFTTSSGLKAEATSDEDL